MSVTNLKNSDMELMYLMHINFRPEDYARLVCSGGCNPADIKVHITPLDIESSSRKDKFKDYLNRLESDPKLHYELNPEHIYDPEIVFTLKYKSDNEGKAYSMQVHPDGFADYVCHRPGELDYGIRWISRTENEDAV